MSRLRTLHDSKKIFPDLFNQAIVQSGSIYSCYNPTPAVPTNPSVQTTTPRPMYDQPNTGYGNAGYQNGYGYQPQSTTPTSAYNSANAQYDDPNQQLAATLCNISPSQWNDGQTQNIQNCLKNYTVDFFVNQQPGGANATWMIVRDTSFLPGSIDSLNSNRPNIPIIIGTVQDEDADYAFKLINTGKGSDPNNLDNWIFDFAKKNKLNQTQMNQVSNIISSNYGVSTGGVQRDQQQFNNQYQNQQTTGGQAYQNQNWNQGPSQQTNNQYQSNQGQQTNNQYQYNQGQQVNNQYQGQQNQQTNQQFFGGVVAGQTTYQNNQNQQGSYSANGQQYNQGSSYQNSQTNNQYQQNQGSNNQQYSPMTYGGQQYNQGSTQQNSQQTNNQYQYQQPGQFGQTSQNQNMNQNQQYQGFQQNNNQYQNGMYANSTNTYNGGVLRDQSSGVQTLPSGVTDFSQLRTISQIASDQSTSLTTTQIQSYMQNGDRHVRIYQFTHVSEVGRNTVPDTGANWKRKRSDMISI